MWRDWVGNARDRFITAISVILASETYQGDITETRAEERRLIAE